MFLIRLFPGCPELRLPAIIFYLGDIAFLFSLSNIFANSDVSMQGSTCKCIICSITHFSQTQPATFAFPPIFQSPGLKFLYCSQMSDSLANTAYVVMITVCVPQYAFLELFTSGFCTLTNQIMPRHFL